MTDGIRGGQFAQSLGKEERLSSSRAKGKSLRVDSSAAKEQAVLIRILSKFEKGGFSREDYRKKNKGGEI